MNLRLPSSARPAHPGCSGRPGKTPSAMVDERRVLERIEQAQHDTPFCECGLPTLLVARTDGLWIECASLSRPTPGRLGALLSRLTAALHTRQLVVEVAALAA
jgi:hypothetical protein